jgi:hypothetical protein
MTRPRYLIPLLCLCVAVVWATVILEVLPWPQ